MFFPFWAELAEKVAVFQQSDVLSYTYNKPSPSVLSQQQEFRNVAVQYFEEEGVVLDAPTITNNHAENTENPKQAGGCD